LNRHPSLARSLLLVLAPALLWACGGSSRSAPTPLAAEDLNLIFVVSPDLAYQTPGDVDPDTANLTAQGLQRSLLMATYLKQQVIGGRNVRSIHVLSPMTHLQTAGGYPDMTAIGFVQPFALQNQLTLPVDADGTTFTAYSFPLGAAYAAGSVPAGVAVPASYCPDCTGLQFGDPTGSNVALVSGLVEALAPGDHVFSAPWETTRALLAELVTLEGWALTPPTAFEGTNRVYAISIAPSGEARLVTLESGLDPPATYPVLPSPVARAACTHALQPYFSTLRIGGVGGAVVPADVNTNERVYIVRHAEAHPYRNNGFEDGNYVGAGEWRALALADALRGRISPDVVYGPDPAQWFQAGPLSVSYVRPSLTVLPYVVANRLPFRLVSSFDLGDPDEPRLASDFLFTGGGLSNHTVLLAWESTRIKPLINALLERYGGSDLPLLPPAWPPADYDTIWTVQLDAQGNLTVDDALCEGIDSTPLPETAPTF
jgi:hypothetical protein